jgi:hypothetical protein
MDSFFKRHDIATADREAICGDMMKKMSKMPATPETPIDEYLDDIYSLVNKGRGEARTVKKTVEKIAKNAKERNSSGDGGSDDDRIKKGSHMPSLDEAVKAAFRGEKLDN